MPKASAQSPLEGIIAHTSITFFFTRQEYFAIFSCRLNTSVLASCHIASEHRMPYIIALYHIAIAFFASLRSTIKDPTVTIQFCGCWQDHLVLRIGGDRTDNVTEETLGIVGIFNPWATEEQMSQFVQRLYTNTQTENLIAQQLGNQDALNLIVRMHRQPDFQTRVTELVVQEYRRFTSDPDVQRMINDRLRLRQLQRQEILSVLIFGLHPDDLH